MRSSGNPERTSLLLEEKRPRFYWVVVSVHLLDSCPPELCDHLWCEQWVCTDPVSSSPVTKYLGGKLQGLCTHNCTGPRQSLCVRMWVSVMSVIRSMCVCMYVCVCNCVWTYMCMCVHEHVCVYECVSICTYVHVCVHMCDHVYV